MAEKIVLLLNDVSQHEGLISSLATSGRIYKRKELHSGISNWWSIVSIFQTHQVVAVIGKMNSTTYYYLVDPEFEEVRTALFQRIAKVPNRIFVFEELLQGIDSPYSPYYSKPPAGFRDLFKSEDESEVKIAEAVKSPLLEAGNQILRNSGLDVFPYRKRAEITVSSQLFIEEIEEGLFFRIYVPSGRLWEGEIGRLLNLFKDYLAKVAGVSVRLDQTSTSKGVIYAFHGHETDVGEGEERESLSSHFEEFSKIADLCVTDPSAAEQLLNTKNKNLRETTQIVSRYAKEMRRLHVDIKHSREEKILSIRHRLESELIDSNLQIDNAFIEKLVDSVVPNPMKSLGFVGFPQIGSADRDSTFTINYKPQIIHKLSGIVTQEVSGNVALAAEDRQILDLFEKHAGQQQAELTSALHELNDETAPEPGRISAKQKIKKFLINCAEKSGDVAFGLLQNYLERKIWGE